METPIAYTSAFRRDVSIVTSDVLRQKEIYQYYFGIDGYEEISVEKDYELELVSSVNSGFPYRSYSAEKMDWILENIFNESMTGFDWEADEGYLAAVSRCRKKEKYYSVMMPDTTLMSIEKIVSKETDYFGSYNIICQYRDIQSDTYSEYIYNINLEEVDEKRYWQFPSVGKRRMNNDLQKMRGKSVPNCKILCQMRHTCDDSIATIDTRTAIRFRCVPTGDSGATSG